MTGDVGKDQMIELLHRIKGLGMYLLNYKRKLKGFKQYYMFKSAFLKDLSSWMKDRFIGIRMGKGNQLRN